MTSPDRLEVTDLAMRRRVFDAVLGWGLVTDDELAALVEVTLERDDVGDVWLRWRNPGPLSRGGALVRRAVADKIWSER